MPVANEWNSYFIQQNANNQIKIRHPDELDRKLKEFGIRDMHWMKWGWHRGPKNTSPQYNPSGNKIVNYTKNMSDIIYDKNNNIVDDYAVSSAKLKALQSYYKTKGYTLPIPMALQSHYKRKGYTLPTPMPHKSKVSNWMPSPPIITTNPVFTQAGAPPPPDTNNSSLRSAPSRPPRPRPQTSSLPSLLSPTLVNPFPPPPPPTIVNPFLMTMNGRVGSAAATVSRGGSTRRGYRKKKITRRRK